MVAAYPPLSPVYGELLLRLINERPLLAADLGGLLGAIAKDYGRITKGRKLVVSRMGEGSLWTIFQDAAGLAAGANSIIKFGETVTGAWKRVWDKEVAISTRKPGFRTIENVVRAAARSGAAVEFEYEKSALGEEKVSLKLRPLRRQ